MTTLAHSHKITPEHLARKALVYLRQSSERQVKENTESPRLQYALAQRARDLGWQAVETIDLDRGRSAAIGAGPREGFERLIAAVALGEVGIVFSREVSRLSRPDKDWCHLLEGCQVFGTLIGDAEQISDLALMDDQLVLGIKATLSIVERKVLKLRLLQGMEEKARRGELKRLLPVGYVRDGTGQVVKDPDQRIQEALALVFRKFRELASGRQTFLWCRSHGVELPVNKSGGRTMRVTWQLPTNAFLQNLLRNPAYAGAYVWGRREVRMALEHGKLRKRQGRLRRAEDCRVFLRDHHAGVYYVGAVRGAPPYPARQQHERRQRRGRGARPRRPRAPGRTAAVRPLRPQAARALLGQARHRGPLPLPGGLRGRRGGPARASGAGSSMRGSARNWWRGSRPWACRQASKPPSG